MLNLSTISTASNLGALTRLAYRSFSKSTPTWTGNVPKVSLLLYHFPQVFVRDQLIRIVAEGKQYGRVLYLEIRAELLDDILHSL
jgi:hypothetical protein